MLLFAALGIAVALVGYTVFDRWHQGDLHPEIIEHKNVAAVIVGGEVRPPPTRTRPGAARVSSGHRIPTTQPAGITEKTNFFEGARIKRLRVQVLPATGWQ